jgi:hypothetical protein
MITSTTIERLCCDLELQWPDAEWKTERLQWLRDCSDAGRYDMRDEAFAWVGQERIAPYQRGQLACEAMKFLALRLAGHGLHESLDRMTGSAHG